MIHFLIIEPFPTHFIPLYHCAIVFYCSLSQQYTSHTVNYKSPYQDITTLQYNKTKLLILINQQGYATVFRVASGELLGKDQPVILQLLELPHASNALKGVCMELDDCAFPLLRGLVQTTDTKTAFDGAYLFSWKQVT